MATVIEISGIEAIEKKLKTLEPKVVRSIFRRNLRTSMKIIKDAAILNLPMKTGTLRRSVKIVNAKNNPYSTGVLVTTGEKGKHENSGLAFYGAFLERGWDLKSLKERNKWSQRRQQKRFFAMLKSGEVKQPTGKKTVPGKYYITRTYNHRYSEVAQKIEQGIIRDIEDAVYQHSTPLFDQPTSGNLLTEMNQ